MTTKFQPLPAPGDIVWCQFPEIIGKPGPKSRPALVTAISASDHAVEVVYGTSQKTNRIYPGEFVIDPADPGFSVSGLAARTKFDFNQRYKLPFDSDWFAIAPGYSGQLPVPKLGVLHPSYMPVAKKAVASMKPKKKT
ncbi:type II toxin-antitoxin system PemK/MazF family toxin [Pseudomonas schmalbachii]|uniref:Type II toxin-antitoxin system PemK/MazF family toxin n=1 Tax=Pseudomonas schmalbachii TaxID=2816993 RepID=A0ABS3TKH1_9PSED|nr:type II toxin-antitoxin system PemK/MazF family toxin [Pseudomonas schmalbachii]MBO3274152.1 type II toxin-antitoxin system PemK/MazF family toxin [Pseudomonas schmalbachii]